jgi:hypothetical protein
MFWLYGSEEKVLVKTRSSPRVTLIRLHLTVWKRTDGSVSVDIFIDTTGVWAVLDVVITERSPTRWEWRVCDRQGSTIIGGFESTRPAAKYNGNRALFLLLSTGWRHFPRSGDRVVGRSTR